MNVMKNIKLFTYTIIFLLALNAGSCKKNESDDTTAPGKVSITAVIPTHGGAKIAYTLPNDDDVLFVKAKYTNSLGNEVFKVSSYYKDTIEIDGFNDMTERTVELFAVDYNNNESESVSTKVTPLISYIYLVQESVSIQADLGGVRVQWVNPSKKMVHVHLQYKGPGVDTVRIVSSSFEHYGFNLTGMDSVEYEFSALVEDFAGNKTDNKFLAHATPMFEELIAKDSWTLMANLSVDGNEWEGVTQNFWDGVVDTHQDASDNSYFIINRGSNGGSLNYPLDIVIDLNKHAIVNRLVVWQRAYAYSAEESQGVSAIPYYYQSENMKAFNIYVSNDALEWKLAGEFEIHDPKDDEGNVPEADILEALNGHHFDLENVTEPFRYLKFGITSSFGSEENVYGSELSLFGLDNVEL